MDGIEKMNKTIFCGMLILSLILSGCSDLDDTRETETKDIGLFISAETIATSWNESIKSTVKTTKGTFTVSGAVSGFTNAPVVLKASANFVGRWYLYIGDGQGLIVIGL